MFGHHEVQHTLLQSRQRSAKMASCTSTWFTILCNCIRHVYWETNSNKHERHSECLGKVSLHLFHPLWSAMLRAVSRNTNECIDPEGFKSYKRSFFFFLFGFECWYVSWTSTMGMFWFWWWLGSDLEVLFLAANSMVKMFNNELEHKSKVAT